MKRIPLTKGYWALVDDDDWSTLMLYKWHAVTTPSGLVYAARREHGKVILMHRSLTDAQDSDLVDHQDHNGLNNQRHNLRSIGRKGNAANRIKTRSPTSSRFKGVTWNAARKKWVAQIHSEGVNKNLGGFHDEKQAALAYDRAAVEHFGDFACLNFPIIEENISAVA